VTLALRALSPLPRERIRAATPQAIGRAATLALYDELALAPKPGLVTLTDRGSHTDMDHNTFMRSLFALRSYFVRIATLGGQGASFVSLQQCGIEAETRMLAATDGINTHRGAIFTLGLLCAAAGAAAAEPRPLNAELLRATLLARWGRDLQERSLRPSTLKGGIAARRYGLRSAAAEAAAGFPVLFDTALPAMRAAMARGLDPRQVRIDTLFAVIEVLDDSNLAHRGGIEGLRFAQQAAREFLAAGGSARPGGIAVAHAIGESFVRRRLSPGGAADTLAAACWIERARALEQDDFRQ
jgi:triphosphoribosyl-dephospho-CoA synthase